MLRQDNATCRTATQRTASHVHEPLERRMRRLELLRRIETGFTAWRIWLVRYMPWTCLSVCPLVRQSAMWHSSCRIHPDLLNSLPNLVNTNTNVVFDAQSVRDRQKGEILFLRMRIGSS